VQEFFLADTQSHAFPSRRKTSSLDAPRADLWSDAPNSTQLVGDLLPIGAQPIPFSTIDRNYILRYSLKRVAEHIGLAGGWSEATTA
jgi:hypothetical protein